MVCHSKASWSHHEHSKNTKQSEYVLTSAVKKQLARKVFPVHRLDHRTSGAILFAFDSQTCGELHDALSCGTKEYIALLRGPWRHVNTTVLIDEPLRDYNTKTMKRAVTNFTMLATQDNAALVLARPITGRTHQIRRHAAQQLGQPVIGDTQHGHSQTNRWWRKERKLDRLALHSLSISLLINDTATTIAAPLSPELKQLLEEEPLWKEAVKSEPRLLLEPIDVKGGTHGRHYRKRQARMEQAFELHDSTSATSNSAKYLARARAKVSGGGSSTLDRPLTPSQALVTNVKQYQRKRRLVHSLFSSIRQSQLMFFSNIAIRLSALRLLPWARLSAWTLIPCLTLYFTVEIVFWLLFHFHILPTCNVPTEPQAYRGYGKDRHRLMLRIIERIERTCRATNTPFLPTFTAYINEWFHHDSTWNGEKGELQMPRKENMDELFSWAFFGKDSAHLEPWMKDELQLIYDMLETRYNLTFEPGIHSSLTAMRLTLDPLEPAYRPLLIYFMFGTIQWIGNLVLRMSGFRFYTTSNGLRYWYRPKSPSSSYFFFGANRGNGPETCAPKTRETTTDNHQLPLLFFHGIAPGGLAPYLPMLLCGLGRGGRPIMLFENPAISFSICLRSHTEKETVEGVLEAVHARFPKQQGVSIVGHSFGSCQVTWLLHSKLSSQIQQVVLVDPVSVLLSEPDVLTNFLYSRKALQEKSRAIGVVANELCIERFLRRDFAWYNSELWLEDIPQHCKVVVCLADKDEILNAAKVKREILIHLQEKGGKLDLILWEGGGHAYCVTRPDAWKQVQAKMRQQEYLIAKEASCR